MDGVMRWGVEVILVLQSFPGLAGLMKAFSSLGTEEFFMLIMPAIYWCVDAGVGLRLATVLVASNGLNGLLKVAFHLPRPYWFDSRVQALSAETSYGLPSGHAMNATTIWGFLAAQLKKWWAWAVALAVIGLISLSRMYLGVHFPTDVFTGWIFGLLLLLAFAAWERPAAAWLKGLGLWPQLGLALAVSLVYMALFGVILMAFAGSPDPAQWAQNATAAAPGEDAINPRDPNGLFTSGGMILGLGAALALWARRPIFSARGPWSKRGARFVVGVVGILVFWLGLKYLTPANPIFLAALFRYCRYGLAVFWALYLAPVVFVKLKLAEPL